MRFNGLGGYSSAENVPRTRCRRNGSKGVAKGHSAHSHAVPNPRYFNEMRGRSGGTRTPNPRFWRPVL